MTAKPVVRCAIYTRKSTEEGLDQDFNSLDAQREACAAYIASQRHEGWKLSPARYDDGGVSGGTLERPSLQRLLADIDAGRIAMVVVYKIDRLTRALADFARLVERFDAAGCSFVSVTQAFNTSTSMGRLTLNVLLSFAQFEREVTGERIRDKIAASKKKGLWMGGLAPLGYDPDPDPSVRGLVVNAGEAEMVRTIFELYDRHGCLSAAAEEARRRGVRSKSRVFASGATRGGGALTRGQIHFLLTNPVYIGRIRHKRESWPGLHPAIIEKTLFDRVQEKLQAASARPRGRRATTGENAAARAALTGKLYDETGDRLTPTHARRRGRRFRYYVSNRLISGGTDPAGWRLPAAMLETELAAIIAAHLEACADGHRLLAAPEVDIAERVAGRARNLAARLQDGDRSTLGGIVEQARIKPGTVRIKLDRAVLASDLEVTEAALSPASIALNSPFELRRRGVEARIVSGASAPAPDRILIRMLARAHCWAGELRAGESFAAIARREGCSEAYIRSRVQVAFLSPTIQAAILDGRQPPDLTLERLIRRGAPLDWDAQARAFGFAARNPHSL